MSRWRTASPLTLAATLTAAGVVHLTAPGTFDGLIPSWLPGPPRAWIYGSGASELLCAAGLLVPRSRQTGAASTALLFVSVFPGNIEMAVHPGGLPRWIALARLPLQVPLVLWALQVGRDAASDAHPATGAAAR